MRSTLGVFSLRFQSFSLKHDGGFTRLRPFKLIESDRSFSIRHRYRKPNKHHLRLHTIELSVLHSIGNAELQKFFVVIDILERENGRRSNCNQFQRR